MSLRLDSHLGVVDDVDLLNPARRFSTRLKAL
jgi:hypothetical protein